MAFNSTGTRLASGSWDQTIKIWDTATFQLLATLRGHKDAIWDVWFIDDQALVSLSSDGGIGLWVTGNPSATSTNSSQSRAGAEIKVTSELMLEARMNLAASAAYQLRGQRVDADQMMSRFRLIIEILVRECPTTFRTTFSEWIHELIVVALESLEKSEGVDWAFRQSFRLVDHSERLKTAEDLIRNKASSASALYDSACHFARVAPHAARDTTLIEAKRAATAKAYADKAMELLQSAVAKGYKNLNLAKKDTDLDYLRTRDDFKAWLAELEKRTKPK